MQEFYKYFTLSAVSLSVVPAAASIVSPADDSPAAARMTNLCRDRAPAFKMKGENRLAQADELRAARIERGQQRPDESRRGEFSSKRRTVARPRIAGVEKKPLRFLNRKEIAGLSGIDEKLDLSSRTACALRFKYSLK